MLQFNRTNRTLRGYGMHPVLGYLLGFAAFILLSTYLFHQTTYGGPVLLLLALGILAKMAATGRTEFLRLVFGDRKGRLIRLLENLMISLPFLVVLLYQGAYAATLLLIAGSGAMAGLRLKGRPNFTLPTPFYRKPFEFTVGFRNTWYLLLPAYILTAIAVSVQNLNLGLLAMLLVWGISMTYYLRPEPAYFVWSYAVRPSGFIFEKMKTATVFAAGLVLPVVASLLLFFPQHPEMTLFIAFFGFVFLWTIILAKYAAYPDEMGLPEGVLIALSIYFLPLLLVMIPFFYFKSIKNLNLLLK